MTKQRVIEIYSELLKILADLRSSDDRHVYFFSRGLEKIVFDMEFLVNNYEEIYK